MPLLLGSAKQHSSSHLRLGVILPSLEAPANVLFWWLKSGQQAD
jgi:hypothetical protein